MAEARAQLGLLVAEAWFRAGQTANATGGNGAADFRSAADAYVAVLRDPPPGVTPGELMFQWVLAETEAGTPESAAAVLDQLATSSAFDAENRWRAEWNLARALQARGKTTVAYARVNRLLSAAGVEAARLSSAVGEPEQTLKLIEGLGAVMTGVPRALSSEITSSSQLLRAEASFALHRDAEALEILQRLRADNPRSSSAVFSYFLEAEHYAEQDEIAKAQRLLTTLADDFPENSYAPFALFQAALHAERQGQEANLKEAVKLIEDLLALVQKYPQPDSAQLVFAARLKQGDVFRRLNDFPAAQRAYEDLVNKFAQRPDGALAQLALAATHNAQAVNEPAHAESALLLFEHVHGRVDAPLDARVEAGFNIGQLYARRGDAAKAQAVWWTEVVSEFLLDPETANQLGDKGRYWMTRTLVELGASFEQQEKLEQAQDAWRLILTAKLGYGETLAKARLARFNLTEAAP
jgi:hypothetical protein